MKTGFSGVGDGRRGAETPSGFAVFTLIELLVVVGIIALLAAILLPALGAAKETARRAKCQSNEKQFVQALFSYLGDWNDTAPVTSMLPVGAAIPGAWPGDPQTFPASGMSWTWNFQLWDYFQNRELLICPSSGRSMRDFFYPTILSNAWSIGNSHGFVYGYNSSLANTLGYGYGTSNIRASGWSSPSETSAFGEVRNWYSGGYCKDGDYKISPYQQWNYGTDTSHLLSKEQLSHRHGGNSVNVAYADGHVTTLGALDIFIRLCGSPIYDRHIFWRPDWR